MRERSSNLKDQIKFTGFGEGLETALKENISRQPAEFTLNHNAKFGNETAEVTLYFKKSGQSDMYFFNKYNLTLKPESSSEALSQTFYIGKTNNITLKEGYNLMNGRAINKDLTTKDGQVYNAWLQMDFRETDKNGNFPLKQYHQNYGFSLEKELAKLPIKELSNEQERAKLVASLQKGNRQVVTLTKEGAEQRVYLEANPRFKTVNIYDSDLQRVQIHSQKEKNVPEQSVKREIKKEGQKRSAEDGEGLAELKQRRSRKKGQSIS
ncbi:MAG: hypothetical protein EOO06_15020 [Chitinophagaceae bacterium]|nr:MAG: hypothetical protein EOO06_15020 [Chitinophagaceae bacterium]